MSDPYDEMPLPSEPVLSEEESSRQLRDDFCRGYKQRAELAEAEVARLTRELGQERQGRPAEQPLIDVPLDRQVVLLNRRLAQALNEVNALQLTLEETQECAGTAVAEALRENTILRGLLPKLGAPCVYCGETEIAKCKSGFPGCAQADDLMCGEDEAIKRVLEERNLLKQRVGALVDALERIDMFPIHSEPVGSASAMQDIAKEALANELNP